MPVAALVDLAAGPTGERCNICGNPACDAASALCSTCAHYVARRFAGWIRDRLEPRPGLAPERIHVTPDPAAKDWTIQGIKVSNVAVAPTDAERAAYRASEERAAAAHAPLITRTTGEPLGPSRIRACACREAGVHDAATWAAHVGIPGAELLVRAILRLKDTGDEVLRQPTDEAREGLRRAIAGASLADLRTNSTNPPRNQ